MGSHFSRSSTETSRSISRRSKPTRTAWWSFVTRCKGIAARDGTPPRLNFEVHHDLVVIEALIWGFVFMSSRSLPHGVVARRLPVAFLSSIVSCEQEMPLDLAQTIRTLRRDHGLR